MEQNNKGINKVARKIIEGKKRKAIRK